MKIKKLRFENHVLLGVNQGAIIYICKNKDGSYYVSYEKNGKKLECKIVGEKIEKLEKKLANLNIHTWGDEYHEDVCDGETWKIDVAFANNEEKTIQGFNGYPDNWKQFLYLYYWVAQCCEETEVVDVSKPVSMDDDTAYDWWELDKKFELLDQETISKMTGTGSGLKRK